MLYLILTIYLIVVALFAGWNYIGFYHLRKHGGQFDFFAHSFVDGYKILSIGIAGISAVVLIIELIFIR